MLFQCLGLLDVPDRGSILVDWSDAVQLSERKRARLHRKKIGFVFQNFQLIPDLSAWEKAILPRQHIGTIEEEWLESVFELLEIQTLRDRYLVTLSGGEQQRVAIARAVANWTRVLLATDPTLCSWTQAADPSRSSGR